MSSISYFHSDEKDSTWWIRHALAENDQPDPYEGSYALTDSQSFNRYGYVGNDPVNFVDPAGLDGEIFFIVSWNGVCSMVGVLVVNQAPGSTMAGGSGARGIHGPLLDTGNEEGGFGGNPFIPRSNPRPSQPPQAPTPPKQPQQPQKQSRKDCVLAAAKKYLGAQSLSLAKIVAFKTGLDFFATAAILSAGATTEAEGILHMLDVLKAKGTLTGAGGVGMFAMGALLFQELKQPPRNFDAYQKAVGECFRK